MNNNGLESQLWQGLHRNLLDGLHGITRLWLQSCDISEIPSGSFRGLGPGLEVLILSNNKITQLNESTFDRLKHVKYLLLSDNKIESIAPGTFNGTSGLSSSLRILFMSNNLIKKIGATVFDGMTNLVFLELSNNNIRNIEPGAFKTLKRLRALGIHANKLQIALPGTFEGLNVSMMNLSVGDPIDDLNLPPDLSSMMDTMLRIMTQFDQNGTIDLSVLGISPGWFSSAFGIDTHNFNLAPFGVLGGNHQLPSTPTAVKRTFIQYLLGVWSGKTTRMDYGLVAGANPSLCKFNKTSYKVECDCATAGWANSLQHYNSSRKDTCVCPEGSEMRCAKSNLVYSPSVSCDTYYSCEPCAKGASGSWNNRSGAQMLRPCNKCEDTADVSYTAAVGSNSSADCIEDPTLVQMARADAEASEADAQTRNMYTLSFSACAGLLLLVFGGLWVYRLQQRNLKLTAHLNAGLLSKVAEQDEELVFLRDWRFVLCNDCFLGVQVTVYHSKSVACSVNENDVELDKKVAQGSEGEVWKGHLRQHGSKPMPLFLDCDPLS